MSLTTLIAIVGFLTPEYRATRLTNPAQPVESQLNGLDARNLQQQVLGAVAREHVDDDPVHAARGPRFVHGLDLDGPDDFAGIARLASGRWLHRYAATR